MTGKGWKVEKIKELFVVVENRPGAVAELCELLAKGKINIEAIGVFQDVAKFSVTDIGRAKNMLIKHDYQVEIREVLKLEVDNKPGAFAALTSKLAAAGINIHYCYGTVARGGRTACIILDVSDVERAVQALPA